MKVRVVEVFSSLQGEGARVGERQVFLRLAGCDRRCLYCDTPESIGGPPDVARIQEGPGSELFEHLPNPVAGEALDQVLRRLGGPAPRPVVTLTGGEPLLQVDFLEAWLPPRREAFRFLLETHGLLPRAVARVLPSLEEVVADVKLPSATGEAVDWKLHHAFVETVRDSGTALTLKAVVSGGTTEEEIDALLGVFERAGAASQLFLQPVTPLAGGPAAPTLEQCFQWQDRGLARGMDLRILPQVHKLMGIL